MTILVHPIKTIRDSFRNYSYLVWNSTDESSVLIDPSWEVDKIDFYLNRFRCRLSAILITHHHYDHINLADHYHHKFNIPVYISNEEASAYQLSLDGLKLFEDGQHIQLDALDIEPIVTPGHTIGGSCFRIGSNVFTGDTLFIEGCGVCVTPDSDPKSLYESLCCLKKILSPTDKIFPGHAYRTAPGCTYSDLLTQNIYFSINTLDDFLRFRLRENQNNLFCFI